MNTAEIRERIVCFLTSEAKRANGALQQRSYSQLQLIVERYFDGVPNEHFYARIDWRVVHRLFCYIFQQRASEVGWKCLGEELYGEMEYLHDRLE
jgi:hypothetical protein